MMSKEADVIDAWVGRLTCEGTLLLAVSGGSDSMAMLCLFDEVVRRPHRAGLSLHVATVDHGLRPDSALEASAVAAFCAARGLSHETLVWRGERPRSRLQQAAREARYRLLRDAMHRIGAIGVVTAHTRDDQRETVAMRHARATTGLGLSGMAEATLYAGDCWILRPLLGTSREFLRDVLRRRKVGWFDDPANADPRFERARLRSRRGARSPDDSQIGETANRRRIAALEAGAFIGAAARMVTSSLALIELPPGASGDQAALSGILEIAAVLGGAAFPPGAAQRRDFAGFLADPARRRHTLLRCVFEKVKTGKGETGLAVWRETRAIPELAIEPGAERIWDGRYRIRNLDDMGRLHVGPPVSDEETGPPVHPALSARILRSAAASEPVMRFAGDRKTMRAPFAPDSAGKFRVDRIVARHDTFLPVFDLMLANALARLFGRPPYPAPPIELDRPC